MDNLKQKVFSGVIWRLLERFGAQLASFVVSVILARLLPQSIFGEISLVMIVSNILQVFVDSGFGNALIQKKNADELDFSTVFYFNFAICIVVYSALFLASPLIAEFYNISYLGDVLKVVGLIVIISGIKNVQQAYVSRHMLFRNFFFSTLSGTVTASVIAIIMAFNGYGIWSLAALYVINPLIDTVVLWVTVKWRPKLVFSIDRLKELYSFGWKLFIVSFITELFNNLRGLIIGKVYSTEDLAYYNNGNKVPQLLANNIDATIRSVLFPALSSEQDNKELVRSHMLKTIKLSNYIIFPLLFGMAACADEIVLVIWTEKWIQSAPYLQIMCFVLALNSIQATNQQAVLALGYSNKVLMMESAIKVESIVILLFTMNYGVWMIAMGALLAATIAMIINLWPNRMLLECSIYAQIRNTMPEVIMSAVMFGTVFVTGMLIKAPAIIVLIIKIAVGFLVYSVGSVLFRMSSFLYLKELLLESIAKRGGK